MKKSNRSKKRKECNPGGSDAVPVDRISNLSEAIISYILSFLPTKDAVATSVLSRCWRHRWTQVTSFDLDDGSVGPQYKIPGYVPKMNFVEFVNMVLLNHRDESMNKFRLKCRNRDFRSANLIIWANTAIARNVKVLDLAVCHPEIPRENYGFQLPGALYSCGTLEVLKLDGPFLVKVPHVVCLPKLAVLELRMLRYESDESVSKLISGCPVLQSLNIRRDYFIDRLVVCTISSPVLKSLEIYCVGRDNIDDLKLVIDSPALEYLDIYDTACREISIQGQTSVNEASLEILCINHDIDYFNMIVELVQAFDRVTYLNLSLKTVNCLAKAANQLSVTFERLTGLVITLDREWNSVMMDLIDRCVNLQVLDITMVRLDEETCSADWSDPVRVPRCLLSSLRGVAFQDFEGSEDDITLLKYILEHGLVMEIVYLSFPACGFFDAPASRLSNHLLSLKSKFHVLNEVSMLPRVSPTCKISWEESYEIRDLSES